MLGHSQNESETFCRSRAKGLGRGRPGSIMLSFWVSSTPDFRSAGAAQAAAPTQFCQYLGIVGSILSDQASTPPVRFFTFWKPAWRRKSTALALRTPERQ